LYCQGASESRANLEDERVETMTKIAASVFAPALILFGIASALAAEDGSVLSYHAGADRGGVFVVPGLTAARARGMHLDPGFQGKLSGHLHAQPLFWGANPRDTGMLIAATESNEVAALDAASGRQLWSRSLGMPVARAALGCGNINPLGVTGTPVIDPQTQAVYLDAAVGGPRGVRHLVFALALKDGAPLPGWPVDVADALKTQNRSFNARDQNQRGALTILDGRVYVPFGGHYGDCGNYHGWVVGISLAMPRDVIAWSTPARGGGIWAPGGIASDGKFLYAATGNTFGAATWMGGEAVVRLAPDLRESRDRRDFFAPENWRALDARDLDLGGAHPVLIDVPRGNGAQALVLALGKDGHAYLLDRGNLGGIGGNLVNEAVSGQAIRTAPAAYTVGEQAFVAFQGAGAHCPGASGNLTVLKIASGSPPSLSTAWCASARGAGSAIVTTIDGRSEPTVWIVGAEGDNRLHGFKGDTGEPVYAGGGPQEAMTGLHHFQTLIVAGERIYVGADDRIYAFSF
jgi:putative pyrroloquinoline-quinone binding quinoprotein